MNGTSTPKGRFVLRADFIRPYNPCGKLALFNKPLCLIFCKYRLSSRIEPVKVSKRFKKIPPAMI